MVGYVGCSSVVSDSSQSHGVKPAGSSVHGISQAKILEWRILKNTFPPSGESSQPRDQTSISSIAGRFSTAESLGVPLGRPRGQTKWKSSAGLT